MLWSQTQKLPSLHVWLFKIISVFLWWGKKKHNFESHFSNRTLISCLSFVEWLRNIFLFASFQSVPLALMVMAAAKCVTVKITPPVITWLVHVTVAQAGKELVVTKVSCSARRPTCTYRAGHQFIIPGIKNNSLCSSTWPQSGCNVKICNLIQICLKNINSHKWQVSVFTLSVCSWCRGGWQSKQFDQCSHTDGHLPDRSHRWNHRSCLVGTFPPPPLHHPQEEAKGQRAHYACGDLLSCHEGPCRLHYYRYVIVSPSPLCNEHTTRLFVFIALRTSFIVFWWRFVAFLPHF